MKKIMVWLYLLTKRQLKNPAIIIFLIGLPLISAILVNIPQMSENGKPRVGLTAYDNDETTVKTIEQLVNGDYSVEFYKEESHDKLVQDISKGDSECGYVFSQDITKKLDRKSYEGCIIRVNDTAGYVSSMADEIVFASMFKAYGKNIAVNYAASSKMFKNINSDAVEVVKKSYEKYADSDITFHLEFEMLNDDLESGDETVAMKEAAVTFPIRGILIIFVYIAGLFGAVMWKSDYDKGVLVTVPYNMRIPVRMMYVFIPTFLFAADALITMGVTKTAVFPAELLNMILYILAITIFGTILCLIIKNINIMISLIPVLVILSLVICPVFVNITTVVPFAKYIGRLLLPYYYLGY